MFASVTERDALCDQTLRDQSLRDQTLRFGTSPPADRITNTPDGGNQAMHLIVDAPVY